MSVKTVQGTALPVLDSHQDILKGLETVPLLLVLTIVNKESNPQPLINRNAVPQPLIKRNTVQHRKQKIYREPGQNSVNNDIKFH